MKKFTVFFFLALLILPLMVLAQDPVPAETVVDLGAYLGIAAALFATGLGGMTVLGIVEIIKRALKIQGIAVRVASVLVSAGFVAIYEIGLGFDPIRAVILTVVIALAANGIYLFPKNQ